MYLHSRGVALGAGVVAFAAGGIIGVVTFEPADTFRAAVALSGIGLLVIGWSLLARVFEKVTRPTEEAWELGYQIGYDKGHAEGRKSHRPVVVPIAMARAGVCVECDNKHRRAEYHAG